MEGGGIRSRHWSRSERAKNDTVTADLLHRSGSAKDANQTREVMLRTCENSMVGFVVIALIAG